jgi:hypothetical protein
MSAHVQYFRRTRLLFFFLHRKWLRCHDSTFFTTWRLRCYVTRFRQARVRCRRVCSIFWCSEAVTVPGLRIMFTSPYVAVRVLRDEIQASAGG